MFEAVSNMNGDKAPGLDGFTMSFFQSCWGILKEDVMKVFRYLHAHSNFEKSLRLCLVRVKAFPENIPFSGKENVFMCLVAFQKIFQKIISGVWKRRRKRQTQKNTDKPQKKKIINDRRSTG